MDVRQAIIAPLKPMNETLVIKPQKVQDCSLEVVDMNRILSRTESEFVALPVCDPTLHASPGHEHGVAIRKVVPPQDFTSRSPAFPEGCSPEFSTPYDEGILKQPSLFQVANQSRYRPVHGRAFFR